MDVITIERNELITMRLYHEQMLRIIDKKLQEQGEPVSTGSPRKGKLSQEEIERKLTNLKKRRVRQSLNKH